MADNRDDEKALEKKDRERLASQIDKKKVQRESDEMFYKNIHSELKGFDVVTLKEYVRTMNLNYDVMILSLCGNLNVGTILRTSHMFGVNKFIVYGKKKFDTRSTVGSLRYTETERVFGLKDRDKTEKQILTTTDRIICPETMYQYLTENNLVPVLIEQHHSAIFLDELNWVERERMIDFGDNGDNEENGKRFCFILGNEGDGISDDVINRCLEIEGAFVLSIRQMGVLRSLNVSAAAAIVIYSYYEHRMRKRTEHLTDF
jgi:tRNA G18 (ribose-2'-O)-methylase SpoU